ncbi:MAG TPA: PAS and ANTAR domain-containing protein [Cellulomonas sp.]
MKSSPNQVGEALTSGVEHAAGAFRYQVTTDQWWWSDEVYRMHGFEPGEVVPTTAMILAHKHPDDRDRYAGSLTHASRQGGSFASVHRIVDANGQERVLAAIGEATVAEDGTTVVAISGHFADVTATVRRLAAVEATRQITEADRHRAIIEQAKGVVAARTGLTPDAAFELLKKASMQVNTKLHDVAGWVVTAAVRRSGPDPAAASWPWSLPDQLSD